MSLGLREELRTLLGYFAMQIVVIVVVGLKVAANGRRRNFSGSPSFFRIHEFLSFRQRWRQGLLHSIFQHKKVGRLRRAYLPPDLLFIVGSKLVLI